MFKTMYLHLFNRVTDALEALDAGDPDRARELLIAGQQECEERYLAGREDDRQAGGEQKRETEAPGRRICLTFFYGVGGGRFVNRPYGRGRSGGALLPPSLGEARDGRRATTRAKRSGVPLRRGGAAPAQRQTSSPFSASTVRVEPLSRSPRRMVRASRVSTLLCSTRLRGRAP